MATIASGTRSQKFRTQVLYQRAREGDVNAMEAILDDHLFELDWPQSTEVCFEISADGKSLMLEVNLPEIEDFPSTELRIYRRGIRVSVKHLSQRALRKLYMAHVHGMGFRLIGEGFACAPAVNSIHPVGLHANHKFRYRPGGGQVFTQRESKQTKLEYGQFQRS